MIDGLTILLPALSPASRPPGQARQPARRKPKPCLSLLLALGAVAALGTGAAEASEPATTAAAGTFTALTVENDWFTGNGEDRWYSSGIKLAHTTEERPPPRWLTSAGRAGAGIGDRAPLWGVALEQRTFTPENITAPEEPPADRPYAGWLNLEVSIAERSPRHLRRLRMGLGITGEPSLAAANQEAIHQLLGADEPVGWEEQLPSEPTFQLGYDQQWIVAERPLTEGLTYRLNTATGASLGTALTQAGAGAAVSLGPHLPRDYGPPRITAAPAGSPYFDSAARSGWYLALGANARLVAHNLFLDGTIFRASPSVEREPAVLEAYAGIIAYHHQLRLSLTWIRRSNTFTQQDEPQDFGTATLTWVH